MSKNSKEIKDAFALYHEVLDELLKSSMIPRKSELFANVVKLNETHLLANLDKVLVQRF